MRLPRGDLLRSHVVDDPAGPLRTALDRQLSGYAVFEPSDALLLGARERGVLTFEAGVPTLAYEAASDRGGPDAIAEFAHPGPYRVELYELPASSLAAAHEATDLRVPPATPATELADDPALAERTREVAPPERVDDDGDDEASALEAFLEDEEKISAIREQARDEAEQRAAEWGLTGELAGDGEPTAGDDALTTE
ncbi:hypothetical protein ACFO0N_11355 [Halobium salinum]|uniref:DUF8054 domain-containing protein n=1 Tax=Halobium salinum TaxID=1364940 RepID=A0ABD5PCC6_9EURY|nr:hypothetical protein [Halobium salinum]